MSRGRVRSWSDEALRAAVAASTNTTDVLRALALRAAGGNHRSIRRHIGRLALDTSHFTSDRRTRALREFRYRPLALDDVFREGSTANRSVVRKRAREQLRPYLCAMCANPGAHLGRPLVPQLDHRNGDPADNRLETLRWLCPNCHSQTSTFAGRSRRSASRAADELRPSRP